MLEPEEIQAIVTFRDMPAEELEQLRKTSPAIASVVELTKKIFGD